MRSSSTNERKRTSLLRAAMRRESLTRTPSLLPARPAISKKQFFSFSFLFSFFLLPSSFVDLKISFQRAPLNEYSILTQKNGYKQQQRCSPWRAKLFHNLSCNLRALDACHVHRQRPHAPAAQKGLAIAAGTAIHAFVEQQQQQHRAVISCFSGLFCNCCCCSVIRRGASSIERPECWRRNCNRASYSNRKQHWIRDGNIRKCWSERGRARATKTGIERRLNFFFSRC